MFALAEWEKGRCQSCGNYDTRVPLKADTRHVTWPDGSKYEVQQYRCQSCGAADVIRRDWMTEHENDKPQKGQFAAGDGRIFVTRPLDEGGET